MPHEWDSFLPAADEWIINYSLICPEGLISVKLFSIGHALELYLKAAYTKITGNIDQAIGLRHDLPKIWKDCQKEDPAFLPGYELRQSVLDQDLLHGEVYSNLDKDDRKHFSQNRELYVVAKYLADLKYLGAPLKNVKGAFALAIVFPNPKWVELFKELRAYLGHPEEGKLDIIQHHIEEGKLPPTSVEFLRQIVNQ